MKTSFYLLILCLSGLTGFNAQAQSSTASLPTATDSQSTMNLAIPQKKFEDTKEITDAKMRADAGSLSKYSIKANLSYYGPTFGDLSAKDQPNPDGSVGVYSTALSGTVGLRYRTSPSTSFSMGTNLSSVCRIGQQYQLLHLQPSL